MSARLFNLCFLAFVLLPAAAIATTRTWPGAAPCATTLQACVDGATNGDRIEIATNTAIAEDISLYNRSLTLTAADGYTPNFGPNHWLSVTSAPVAGDLQVSVSRLSFTDGYVFANYNGAGTATYDLRELTLTRVVSDVANYIEVDANNGTTNATLYDNRLTGVPSSLNSGLIQLTNSGATLNATAYYNHVTSTSAASVNGAGIFVDVHANGGTGGGGTIKLHGNEVRGGFYRAGIFVSEGLFTTTASTVTARVYNNVSICADTSSAGTGGSGIGFVANNGSINAQAINNTASRCYYGLSALQWSGGGGGASISGTFNNNLVIAYNGLALAPSVPGSRSNDYNLINATTSSVAYGSHTLTAPAQLVLDTQPRLRPTSPAIDAADSATLGFGLLFNGLPTNDADGLRRFKGASADIGAYESGDVNFTHTARSNTIFGNSSDIDNTALNANPAAVLIATPNYNIGLVGGVSYDHPFGAYFPSPQWSLFNQDSATAMPLGTHFDVMVPASGGGSFIHTSTASSIGGLATTISDSSTDNLSDRIVLVTQNWTAGGASLYNPHPVGVYYGGDSKWHIANLDGATMQQPLGFNVYAQQPSPNAWRVTASVENLHGSATSIRLDHPLLDNTPCARPQVARLLGAGLVSGNIILEYLSGKWYIYGYSGISAGEQFHVLIDPAQVFDCTDRIFADGLQ